MNNRKQIFEERKYLYFNEKKQTGIIASIVQDENGVCIVICDKYGKIQPSLKDIPVLIKMLKRLLKSRLS